MTGREAPWGLRGSHGPTVPGLPRLSPDCKVRVQKANDTVVTAGSVVFAGTLRRVPVPALLFTGARLRAR